MKAKILSFTTVCVTYPYVVSIMKKISWKVDIVIMKNSYINIAVAQFLSATLYIIFEFFVA